MKIPDEILRILNGPPTKFDETQTKQFLIFPLLQALGYNTYDREELWPEYKSGTKKFDIALRHDKQVRCVIEAKRLGTNLSMHKKQLLEYSFQSGVPIAILTDGKLWWFYLSTAETAWENRFVKAINIAKPAQINDLYLFLEKTRLFNGKALASLQDSKSFRNDSSKIKGRIPEILANLPETSTAFREVAKYISGVENVNVNSVNLELRNHFSALTSASRVISARKLNKPVTDLLAPTIITLYGRKLTIQERSYTNMAVAVLAALSIYCASALRYNRAVRDILQKYFIQETMSVQNLITKYDLQSFKTIADPTAKIYFTPKGRYREVTITNLINELQRLMVKKSKKSL